jgi:hypothetical protein
MLKGSVSSHQILFAVAGAAVILAPSHFAGIGRQIWTGNIVMNADLSATQAREKRLRLIGASLAV